MVGCHQTIGNALRLLTLKQSASYSPQTPDAGPRRPPRQQHLPPQTGRRDRVDELEASWSPTCTPGNSVVRGPIYGLGPGAEIVCLQAGRPCCRTPREDDAVDR